MLTPDGATLLTSGRNVCVRAQLDEPASAAQNRGGGRDVQPCPLEDGFPLYALTLCSRTALTLCSRTALALCSRIALAHDAHVLRSRIMLTHYARAHEFRSKQTEPSGFAVFFAADASPTGSTVVQLPEMPSRPARYEGLLHIGNIPPHADEAVLSAAVGLPLRVEYRPDPAAAVVRFESHEQAQQALDAIRRRGKRGNMPKGTRARASSSRASNLRASLPLRSLTRATKAFAVTGSPLQDAFALAVYNELPYDARGWVRRRDSNP